MGNAALETDLCRGGNDYRTRIFDRVYCKPVVGMENMGLQRGARKCVGANLPAVYSFMASRKSWRDSSGRLASFLAVWGRETSL